MTISTGIWLVILTGIVVIYSIYFFGDASIKHRTLRDRLRTIILPGIDFQASSLEEAASQLSRLSETYDTVGDGVEFSVTAAPEGDSVHAPLLLTFHNTSLWDATELIALYYGINYSIDNDECAVTFNAHKPPPRLVKRTYTLPVSRFPMSWACKDYLAYFKGYGLPFPAVGDERSAIEHNESARVITVYTVENTLNLMEKMFDLDPDRTTEK